jgi:hypothetical protein
VAGLLVALAAFTWRPPAKPTVRSVARLPAITLSVKKMVRIQLRATPADARFSIDDGPLLENPHVGDVEADGLQHRIRIEAPGHVMRTRVVTFADDVDVEVSLKRSEQRGAAPRRAPPPRSTSNPAGARPRPAGPPKRELDPGNPWD